MTTKTFDTWFREFPAKFAPLERSPGKIKGKVCYRFMELDHSRAQSDQRTIEATLSTEMPVVRAGFREILRHDESSIDLERATDDTLPLLWSHNQEQQIGVAENVRLHHGKLRARLRFSESTRGEEIWKDVQQGIIRGISIGYTISEYSESQDSGDYELTATRWTPFEASCVSVPADTSAGIGRALESGSLRELPPDIQNMYRQHRMHTQYQTMLDQVPEIMEAEPYKDRIKDIQVRMMAAKSDSDAVGCIELTRSCTINFGADLDEGTEVSGIRSNDDYYRESNPMEEFSLCRALAMTFDPAAARTGGPELQIMQDTAKRCGKGIGERQTLPEEALFRAVTKGGDGANLIATSHMASMFIPALRERMISGRMGATLLPGLTGDLQIPRQTADSTATWLAGDGSDQVVASDPSYDKITLSPTSVGCSSTISRKMLLQGDPASEQLVRESLAFAVAKAIDTAAINGDGTSNVPTGILNQTNVATATYALAGDPSFANIVDMEGALMTDDADVGNLGYVTTGAIAATMKQTEVVSTTGNMIWTATDQGEGRMNGYRALTSNLLPAGHILFGNWSDLILALWSGLDFVVDPYTRASYGDVIITVFMDVDIAVRHGESFAELHEALS